MIDGILIYPLLTAALYYLGARALVTKWLWSRYPKKLDDFMNCAACSGFWYGVTVGLVGHAAGVPFLGSTAWSVVVVIGLASVIWTPVVANLHDRAIAQLSAPDPIPLKQQLVELIEVIQPILKPASPPGPLLWACGHLGQSPPPVANTILLCCDCVDMRNGHQ